MDTASTGRHELCEINLPSPVSWLYNIRTLFNAQTNEKQQTKITEAPPVLPIHFCYITVTLQLMPIRNTLTPHADNTKIEAFKW